MSIRNITITRAATFDRERPYCWLIIDRIDEPPEIIKSAEWRKFGEGI